MMEEAVLEADLHVEDDHGNNWTLVPQGRFDPAWLHPGSVIRVGRVGADAEAQVLRTELHLGTRETPDVLVTFRQTAIRSLRDALAPGSPPGGAPATQLRDSTADLSESHRRALVERDEARAWARAEYYQMWDAPFIPENYPGWLTEPG
jgi:hypothetical protein